MSNSPISYFGGKYRLSKRIIPLIPKHTCYVEPFCGAAWVLFKKEPSKHEVINDLDNELVNFWRVIQNHIQPFLEYFKYAVISRKMFDLENRKDPSTLTDLQRAVRYYYLQRLTFAGKSAGRIFAAGPSRPTNLNLLTLEESIIQVHWRLSQVTIENLDACKCIQKYDRPDTFHYVDPPYWDVLQDYAHKFAEDDFTRLRLTLDAVKGKFILSLNDKPDVRRRFKGFKMIAISTTYSSGNTNMSLETRGKPRGELLIHNM
ncbi:MAG: DNA adenine methylase [Kiritimatiellia bacterium]|jgi:DNA adenine methylase